MVTVKNLIKDVYMKLMPEQLSAIAALAASGETIIIDKNLMPAQIKTVIKTISGTVSNDDNIADAIMKLYENITNNNPMLQLTALKLIKSTSNTCKLYAIMADLENIHPNESIPVVIYNYDNKTAYKTDRIISEMLPELTHQRASSSQNTQKSLADKTSERINAIKKHKAEKDKADYYNKAEMEKLENYIKTNLSPRIQELTAVANACRKNGIKISRFCTDSMSHAIGFISMSGSSGHIKPDEDITAVGYAASGICHRWDLCIDRTGVYVIYNSNNQSEGFKKGDHGSITIHKKWIKRFIKEFESFETMFYDYVDNLCNIERPAKKDADNIEIIPYG